MDKLLDVSPDLDTVLDNKKNISNWRRAEGICNLFNILREEYIDPKKLIADDQSEIKSLGLAYQWYLNTLEEINCIDFSNIQRQTYELIKAQTEVLERLQEQIQYVMIAVVAEITNGFVKTAYKTDKIKPGKKEWP